MLTTQPHLRTRRPSPTTVEYTVSTSPSPTLTLRLLLLTTILLRLLVGLSVVLLLYSKCPLDLAPAALTASQSQTYTPPQPLPPVLTTEYAIYILYLITSSPIGLLFARLAAALPLTIIIPLCTILLYGIFLRLHTTESVLVLRGLGIQTVTSSTTYLSTATTRFISTEKIQDILVNEAFRGFEVRYYLVVVVEGEEEVVVVFPKLLPRRKIVETVWRGVRGCLFEPDAVGKDGKG